MFYVIVLRALRVLRGDWPLFSQSPIFELFITDHPAEPLSRLRVVKKRNTPATPLVDLPHPVGVLLAMPHFVRKDFYPFLISKPGNERGHGRAMGTFSPKEFHQVRLGFHALSIHLLLGRRWTQIFKIKIENSRVRSKICLSLRMGSVFWLLSSPGLASFSAGICENQRPIFVSMQFFPGGPGR